jgi:transposase-like protein/DNA-directed RNA polymerase subunit RPC12/RpoP
MKTIDEKIKNNVYKDTPPLAHKDQGSNPHKRRYTHMNNKTITNTNQNVNFSTKGKSTSAGKPSKYPNVFCDRCGSNHVIKYGKEQKTNLQKYKCKICGKQFVPERTKKPTKHIHGNCPLCSSRLDLRKSNKNSIQLRCSKRCGFTISYNKKLKKFFYQALTNKNFFKLPKFFRYPQEIILFALRLYFVHKLSLRKIQKEIKLQFPQYKTPSHVAIIKWANKLSYLLSLAYINKNIVSTGKWFVWLTDETVIKINGSKYYLIVVMDHNSGCVLSWFLSPTRDAQAISYALKLAVQLTNSYPQIIISDHAQNIQLAVQLTLPYTNHIQTDIYSSSNYSNNKLERFFSNIKQKIKQRNGFRSEISAVAWLTIFFTLHNIKITLNHNVHNLSSLLNRISIPIAKSLLLICTISII